MSAKRIFGISLFLLLIATAFISMPLILHRTYAPQHHAAIEEHQEFQLTPQLAQQNDRDVLLTVLATPCRDQEGYLLLSDEPTELVYSRKQLGLVSFPPGIGCPSVRLEKSSKLDAAITNCPRKRKSTPQTMQWPCFSVNYPGARGILSMSLPVYSNDKGLVASVQTGISCGWRCGTGWKLTLRKVNGKWLIVRTEPAWIA